MSQDLLMDEERPADMHGQVESPLAVHGWAKPPMSKMRCMQGVVELGPVVLAWSSRVSSGHNEMYARLRWQWPWRAGLSRRIKKHPKGMGACPSLGSLTTHHVVVG